MNKLNIPMPLMKMLGIDSSMISAMQKELKDIDFEHINETFKQIETNKKDIAELKKQIEEMKK